MFRVGQKVVCVDDADTCLVKNGKIYTVFGVGPSPILKIPMLWLVEIRNDGGMYARRFRPIVERKTDISIFTKMLKTEYVS